MLGEHQFVQKLIEKKNGLFMQIARENAQNYF